MLLQRYVCLDLFRRTRWWKGIAAGVIAAMYALAPSAMWAQAGAAKDPDVLILGNGEKLIGHLVGSTGGSVTFHSETLGNVIVDWAKVKELHSAQNFAVIPKGVKIRRKGADGQVSHGSIDVTDQKIAVKPSAGAAAQTVAVADAAYVVDDAEFQHAVNHNDNLLHDWKGGITAGASLVEATQNSETFTGSISLVRTNPTENWLEPRNRTLVNFTAAYGKVDQPNTPTLKTEIYHADVERDEYISSRLYGFGSAAFDHNFSQGLSLEQTYGGGIGWTVLRNDIRTLDLKALVGYQSQDFTGSGTGLDQNLIVSVFTENYRRKLPKGMLFTQQAAFTPAWNNTKAYSAVASAGLQIPAYKRMNVSLNTLDDFLNDPPPGFKKNSFQFTLGLTYALP